MDKIPVKIKSVSHKKAKLNFRNDNFGFVIDLSKISKDLIDTIIEIQLD